MNKYLISAFAICVAMAAPTALWAADEHQGGASHGSSGLGQGGRSSESSHGSQGSHGSSGGSGEHGSTSGGSHRVRSTHTTSKVTGPAYHSYQYRSTTNTAGHLTAGHHPAADVSKFRKNVTADRHFHFRDYHGPAGYSYHRWSYGENLPAEYWAQEYWITNFLNFGLEAPPDGYVWVQYGDDALLIDEDTGEIIETEYGIFD